MSSDVHPGLADRVYRVVLHCYPRSFRARFGDEMIDFFHARLGAARARGTLATVAFWLRTMTDAARSLWREHAPDAALPLHPRLFASRVGADLRDSLRFLRRSPGTSLTVVLLMMLTIGAATSVFSVVNTVLIKPLPFGDPDRLVILWESRPEQHLERIVVSGHEFPLWEEQNRSFERMGAIALTGPVTLTGAGDPKSLGGARVTSGFFDVMGVRPLAGRTFRPDEDIPGRGDVVVLAERLWRERFSGDSGIVGRTILLDERPVEVVGIMGEGFNFPPVPTGPRVDFWQPIAEPIRNYRGRHYLSVVAKLKPGVTIGEAQQDMNRVAQQVRKEFPELNHGHEASVLPLQRDLVRNSRASLVLLLGSVSCLLLIGCSNIAGLLLARGMARSRELTVRLALGGTRMGVARQLLTESLLLALAGATLGVLVTFWLVGAVPSIVPSEIVALDRVTVDSTVLAFALLASVATGLLFGIAPALQIRSVSLSSVLQQGGRTLMDAGQPRVRMALIAGQVALTLVLTLGAGLLARGLVALETTNPGYRTEGLLTLDLSLPGSRYRTPVQQRQFYSELMSRASTLPGVISAGGTNSIPLGGGTSGIAIGVEGAPPPAPGQDVSARFRVVSTDYFKTMEIPLIRGRAFESSDARLAVPLIRWFPQQPIPEGFDRPQPAPVAVINAAMAQQFWPDADAVGKRFRVLQSPWITVVGVVANTRNESLRDPGRPELYLTDLQEPQRGMTLVVKTDGDPLALAGILQSTIWDLDRTLAITSMRTMDDVLGRTIGLPRLTSWIVGVFALLAIGLMVAGIYGLLAFTTAQRLPELGLRLALGAARGQVLGLVVRQGLAPAIVGVIGGLIAAAWLVRIVGGEIFGVPPVDLVTWVSATLVLLAAVLAACWWPAHRASRVDPVSVLRAN